MAFTALVMQALAVAVHFVLGVVFAIAGFDGD
jgi:hypothetical protein